MIITCKECNSSFNVDDGLIKETGTKVRCSKCENIFVAYPYSPEDDLRLDSDEQLPVSDENSELDDLDFTLDGFFSADESFEATTSQKKADDKLGLGLGLDDPKEKLDVELGPEIEPMLEGTIDDLNPDLDLDDRAGLDKAEASMTGDELPDLEDLSALDDESLSVTGTDTVLEDLDLGLDEAEKQETTEKDLAMEDGLNQADQDFEIEETVELEAPSTEDSEDLKLGLQLDSNAENTEDDEMSAADIAVEETDELDLSDLDLESDDVPAKETASVDESEDLDLDLQFDIDAESTQDDEMSAADIALEETDELDLSDLDLESDDAPAEETVSADESENPDLDLQFDIDAESTQDDEMSAADIALEETDELDLSDLDLESDDAPAEETVSADESENPDLDLQFDIDAESTQDDEMSTADMAVEETDELDLSDLDLESDDVPAKETASVDDSEDLNLGLDLESETIAGSAENISDELDLSDLEEIIDSDLAEPDDNALEELELDLENNDDQEILAADATDSAEDDDQLDFSDLESMLQSGDTPEASAEVDDADEPDLQFDIDETVADVVDSSASEDADDADREDSLLDIEKMLEENEDTADEDVNAPLELDTALEDISKEEDELELDFDLESELQEKEDLLVGSAAADEQLESNLLTSDQAGNEGVEFTEEEFQGAVTTDEFATDELLGTSDTRNRSDVPPAAANPPAAMMPKSRSKKPVLVALLLLFLAGGILIVPNMLGIRIPYISDIKIPYISDLDIRIPYLSDKLNPKEKDVAGNLKIIPLGGTINARFVSDAQGKQRFVIHGKIKNDYDHPRSFIKVTGKIYQKGGKLVKTETVYCGNLLSDSELIGMNILAINKRLHNRFGDKRSNLKVKTGKSIPFMIVFDKLPENLDEYTVEVDGSSI